MGAVISVARRHGVLVHLDGARIFNAAVALGVPAKELTRDVDSVTFCLSKGLACPIGSVVCGSKEYIQRARKIRKMVGGGLRQAGVIAAPGIVALEKMVDRLAEDHDNARLLAEGLAELPGIILDPRAIQSNIVIFDLAEGVTTDAFLGKVRAEGVLANATAPQRIRMVTHYGITADDVKVALAVCRRALVG
jgi:threonine aldolase